MIFLPESIRAWVVGILLILVAVAVPILYVVIEIESKARSLSHADVHQVTRFATALRLYSETYGAIPGPSLKDAVAAIRRYEKDTGVSYSVDWRLLEAGRTPYGGTLFYEWLDNGRHVQIRSTGPNMQDDHGHGDDVQAEVSLPHLRKKGE